MHLNVSTEMLHTSKGGKVHLEDSDSHRNPGSETSFGPSPGAESITSRTLFYIQTSDIHTLFPNGKISFVFNLINASLN